jgi:hypothetical protein
MKKYPVGTADRAFADEIASGELEYAALLQRVAKFRHDVLHRHRPRYGFKDLEVGQYFDVPRDGQTVGEYKDRVQSILCAAASREKRLTGRTYSCKLLNKDYVRVTREK